MMQIRMMGQAGVMAPMQWRGRAPLSRLRPRVKPRTAPLRLDKSRSGQSPVEGGRCEGDAVGNNALQKSK